MEISVWIRRFAQVASSLSSLFAFSRNPSGPVSGGVSQNVQENVADLILPLMNATILAVTRNQKTANALFGEMSYNGERICFTLENRALAIPEGRYRIEIYASPHAGHPVPMLQNVPGRSEIEIHCGNTPEDSKGCLLVGLDHIGNTLERSRDAFNILFPLISSAIHTGVDVQLVLTDSYTS